MTAQPALIAPQLRGTMMAATRRAYLRTGLLAAGAALLTLGPPAGAAPNPKAKAAPAAAGTLTAAEVNSQIVGHSVALEDGGMTWYYNPGGKYDGDDGRNARGGTYAVRPDGRLCWTEATGVSGCFQYYRKAGKLQVRRADPGHDFELGAVKLGPL
jgi:hypothetical protein